MGRWKLVVMGALAACACAAAAIVATAARGDAPTPVARGPHVSGAVRYQPQVSTGAGAASVSTCSTPGLGNYRLDCHSSGRPVNETWIGQGAGLLVAGANDYNSYNGQGQNGYYWSSDGGKSWNDAGPIDVFPHNPNNAAGDTGVRIDASGVVYYSSIFFNFYSCKVGGVELLRRDPATGTWTYTQIAANSPYQFQDKPAISLDAAHVYVSWTQFGSCSGSNVPSPIKVAILPTGATSVPPSLILSVPGSTYSQGSSISADGSGGFWIAWEEWPSATAKNGSIKLAHWSPSSGWNVPQTISPPTFADLPSPLPGFAFRTDSFPVLTAGNGGAPAVAWTSNDTGVGRAYLWTGGVVTLVSPLGDDQFFPALKPDGAGGLDVAFSQTSRANRSYDEYVVDVTGGVPSPATKVSTASSFPGQDSFFSGQFIGDYNSMSVLGTTPHPTWTDIRGPDPSYPGYEMDAFTYAP